MWAAAPGSPPGCSSHGAVDVLGLEPDPRMAAVARRQRRVGRGGHDRGVGRRRAPVRSPDRRPGLALGRPARGRGQGGRGAATPAAVSACSGTRPNPAPRCARHSRRRTPATPRSSGDIGAPGSTGRVVVRVHRRRPSASRGVRQRGGRSVRPRRRVLERGVGGPGRDPQRSHTLPPAQLAELLAELRRQIDRGGGRVPVRYETTLVSGSRR